MPADAQASIQISTELVGVPAAIQSIEKLRKAQTRQFKGAQKAAEQANKLAKKLASVIRNNSDAEARAKKEAASAERVLLKGLQRHIGILTKMERVAESLKTKEGMLVGKEKATAKKKLEILNAQIKKREELIKANRRQALGEEHATLAGAVDKGAKKRAKEKDEASKKAVAAFANYRWGDAGKDVAGGFKDAIGALSARDLKGMAGGLAKSFGSSFKGLAAGAKRYSLKKSEDPNAGAIGKGLGKAMGAIGNLGAILAKLGPILSMVGGLVMAVVKLIIDADSAAKEFNKELLATASTSEHLYAAGGDANASFEKLNDTMTQIRKSAVDLESNMDWGISKKQHLEFLGVLTSEGVAIKRIEQDAEAAGMAVGDFSAEMVHVGVAYSRMFGVSLQEIGTLQSEMMRDMGASLETVTQSFNMMARGASESGIASNKFFAIIRGVSADMSLFNLRMEDAVLTLKMLGKAMSPKNAEKFLQTITNFYKGQGLQERIGSTLKAGGTKAVGGMLQQDVTARIEGMSNDVASRIGDPAAAGELRKAIQEGPAATSKFMAKHQDKLDGSVRESIMDAALMQGKLNKGGLVDVASALKDASPAATMKMWDMQAQKFFNKPMEELTDVERLAFEKLSGVTDEMQDQAVKARASMKQMKEDLAYKLETGGKLTEEQTAMAKAMNLQGTKEQQAAAVRGKTDEQVWGTMSELQRKQAKGTDDVKDYAKKQVEAIDTVSDKLERIFDALMEFVYQELSFLSDLVHSLVRKISLGIGGPSDDELTQRKIRKAASKSKDPAVQKALKDAGKDAKTLGSHLMKSATWQEGVGSLLSQKTEKGSKQEGIQKDFLFRQLQKGISGSELGKAVSDRNLSGILEKANLGREMVITDEQGQHREFEFGEGVGPSDVIAALEAGGTSMDDMGQLVQQMFGRMGQIKMAEIGGDVLGDAARAAEEFNAAEQANPTPTASELAPDPTAFYGPEAQAPIPEDVLEGSSEMPANMATTADNTEGMQSTLTDMASTAADQNDALQSQSTVYFKFPLPYLNGAYSKAVSGAVEEGVLKAVRLALFEYFMYSGMNPEDLAEGLKKGDINPATFGQDFVSAVGEKGYTEGSESFLPKTAPANAAGGLVTGVAGGLAVVKRPAAGEGFASVGKGEAISPAGGRGGGAVTVKLELSQDLKKVIQAESANVVYLDKARSKYQG